MSALRERLQNLLRRQHLVGGAPIYIRSRHIYILPTRYGWLFGVLLVLMLLASLNYDNNPAYLLTFLLFGLTVNAMFFTWRNLFGVQMQLMPIQPVFAGESARLNLSLQGGPRPGLALAGVGQVLVEDLGDAPLPLTLDLPTQRRGWLRPDQLVLSTRYPLGLFRAWSILEIDDAVLVYPRPAESQELPQTLFTHLQGTASGRPGEEELYGLREFRPGDPLAHADWKGLARERGLMTKQFSDPAQDEPLVIEWEQLAPRGLEQRLSVMTRLVIDAEQARRDYGLGLPGRTLEPGRGPRHYRECLKALALFGLPLTGESGA